MADILSQIPPAQFDPGRSRQTTLCSFYGRFLHSAWGFRLVQAKIAQKTPRSV